MLGAALPLMVGAAGVQDRLLILTGSDSPEVYAGFAASAAANAKNKQVKILVLPTAYSSNAESITGAERAANLQEAEAHRVQIQEACQHIAPPGVTCSTAIVPVFTRADALDLASFAAFTEDLSAIYILGGNGAAAMQAISNTSVERALSEAYQRGIVLAGAGGMQSVALLAGYTLNFTVDNVSRSSVEFGAVDVWNTAEKRGLSFGIKGAIVDERFFQEGRVGRLLNAIALPGAPHVGIGVDAGAGVHVSNGARLQDVFGLSTVAILDAETYHAADAVRYRGANYTLSLRNVLVHLLAPGNFAYDLAQRQHSLGAPPPTAKRTFSALALPKGAGPLLLASNLRAFLQASPRPTLTFGGARANIVIVAAGYPSESDAQADAEQYAEALDARAQTIVASPNVTTPVELPASYTGILLVVADPSQVAPEALAPIKAAWLAGKPLLADDAAAAMTGKFFSAPDSDKIIPGLGLLNLTIEQRILSQNRWGRLFSLAYAHPDLLALALADGAVLELGPDGAQAVGEGAILALDLRNARLKLGANKGYVMANGLLDVFAAGDAIKPEAADVNAAPTRAATPILPTATLAPSATPPPTLTPSAIPATPSATPPPPTPSRTPGPTTTPAPPPGASGTAAVIGWGALAVGVVLLLGLLLLRRPA